MTMSRALLRGPLSRSAGIRVLPAALQKCSTPAALSRDAFASDLSPRGLCTPALSDFALPAARVCSARLGPSRAGRPLRLPQLWIPAALILVPKHPGILPDLLSSSGKALRQLHRLPARAWHFQAGRPSVTEPFAGVRWLPDCSFCRARLGSSAVPRTAGPPPVRFVACPRDPSH